MPGCHAALLWLFVELVEIEQVVEVFQVLRVIDFVLVQRFIEIAEILEIFEIILRQGCLNRAVVQDAGAECGAVGDYREHHQQQQDKGDAGPIQFEDWFAEELDIL